MKKLNKGFTLAELLIVVAIIAVLVAVAIPTFNSQLEKSRQSTDLANLRGAYAAAKIAELNGEVPAYDSSGNSILPVKIGSVDISSIADENAKYSGAGYVFVYDADSGILYPWNGTSGNTYYKNNASGITEAATVSSSDSSVVKTSLRAHSTKIVIDTSNLPGANDGIVKYGVRDSTTYSTTALAGNTNAAWPDMKIVVQFTDDEGVWSLKSTTSVPAIRFENVGSASATGAVPVIAVS